MVSDDHKENYIRIIEAQPSINGRFTNVRRIDKTAGCGNFSLVFSAFDEEVKQEVALKFYNPLRRGDTYRESCFYRESEILERLKGQKDILQIVHPKEEFVRLTIDSTTGISTKDILLFFVTELAHSNTLNYTYSDEATPLQNLNYFRMMYRAVQRIHSKYICHRDIKPENYFIMKAKEICLGDFGTARVLDGSMPPLKQDYYGWRGDKRYTAPEQCIDMPNSTPLFYIGDMYSLGAILFEMFTKQPLFNFVFNDSFHADLSLHFQFIAPENRETILRGLVPTIAQARRLPNIWDFDVSIPNCIKERVNRLYKGLSCLNYRNRLDNFVEVFHQINICERILEKEKAYDRFIKLRRVWQEARKSKRKLHGNIVINGEVE